MLKKRLKLSHFWILPPANVIKFRHVRSLSRAVVHIYSVSTDIIVYFILFSQASHPDDVTSLAEAFARADVRYIRHPRIFPLRSTVVLFSQFSHPANMTTPADAHYYMNP